MKAIQRTLAGFLLLLTAGWALSEPGDLVAIASFFDFRSLFMQWSGVIAIGVMSLAMILSLRPAVLEPYLGGLDKLYRLHKWLGITALGITLVHWLMAKSPKWLIALGWLERRGRRPRPSFPEGSLQGLFAGLHGLAEDVGEWAFYGALVLMLIALIKAFPYRRFVQTHRLLPLAYLALVFHAVILLKFDAWRGPIGPLLVALMALGSVAAVSSLLGWRPGRRPVTGTVTAVATDAIDPVLTVDLRLDPGWPGHTAGQFAFVTFDSREGAHPFTLASAWRGDGYIQFRIKALGDYTRTLAARLHPGARVSLEGPYGRFTFGGNAARQIWIAGGIGITPFLARLQALAATPDGRRTDLFHCTARYSADAVRQLRHAADAAGVRLHMLWDERDGRLDAARLAETVPDWRDADIWFCGPAPFGDALRTGLVRLGLPARRFHQELFEMR
ncbi:MAG TPA: ferric reductase-like transmembrane domain-containing protein [Rhodocyclaceae bacterium]|nr:ferric reductase-like transmembrane domain-containing protein [Rhodocyclaceae bacterium]